MYWDLHGHSRKHNAFMYGCEYMNTESKYNNFLLRAFPAVFSHLNSDFKFSNWSFKWEKTKEKTGRIVCFKELGITHSFTQETSFYGRERKEEDLEDTDLHMGVEDFKQLGVDLVKAIAFYQDDDFVTSLETEASKFK